MELYRSKNINSYYYTITETKKSSTLEHTELTCSGPLWLFPKYDHYNRQGRETNICHPDTQCSVDDAR